MLCHVGHAHRGVAELGNHSDAFPFTVATGSPAIDALAHQKLAVSTHVVGAGVNNYSSNAAEQGISHAAGAHLASLLIVREDFATRAATRSLPPRQEPDAAA